MSKYYFGVDDVTPIYDHASDGTMEYLMGVQVKFHGKSVYFPCEKYALFDPEECRKQAHDEVWDMISTIVHMCMDDQSDCFGFINIRPIMENLDYQKAKEKYDAWTKKNTVREMTVEEVSQALGYTVKIVSKKGRTM